jgi:hypothetical protein
MPFTAAEQTRASMPILLPTAARTSSRHLAGGMPEQAKFMRIRGISHEVHVQPFVPYGSKGCTHEFEGILLENEI